MPIRFSTEAANADVLGEDTQIDGTPEALPRKDRAGRAPADRFERPHKPQGKAGEAPLRNAKRDKEIAAPDADVKPGKDVEAPGGDVKPGKDINAAGFIKDKDA